MCRSHSTAVVQSAHSADSAVVTLSPNQEVKDIPPMFQLLNLPKFARQLQLVVDSASPITFVNSKTWNDLDKPKLQPTDRVLGANLFIQGVISKLKFHVTISLKPLQSYRSMSRTMGLIFWGVMDEIEHFNQS